MDEEKEKALFYFWWQSKSMEETQTALQGWMARAKLDTGRKVEKNNEKVQKS
jgi:hypothetical protein